jgi:hypothetical protein
MDDFHYSVEAAGVINHFYGADIMVYVEGEDDIPYWELIFNKFSKLNIELQDVGSCTSLKRYISQISSGELNAIVAMDKDFTLFSEENVKHPNILFTPKYAIENSLVSQDNVYRTIKTLAKVSSKKIKIEDIHQWFLHLSERFEKLIALDIYNAKYGKGIAVLGKNDTADRFFVNNSFHICQIKVDKYLEAKLLEFESFNALEIKNEVEQKGYALLDFARGHFIFSAVTKFMKNKISTLGSNVTISHGAFFGHLILSLDNTLNEHHCHYNYFKEQFKNISIRH